ncbi:MAG TPA: ferrous iron transport protein B [Bdellovibrionota bacterium]|jgi:ferrous iron transport protein B
MNREVILAGRPNSGKSTLFNRLASAHQKVGNYAGCTVEKKTAFVQIEGGRSFEITDLPGVYSLKANSLDEEVALRHLEDKRDSSRVVFVLDGNNLEQELVLPLMLKKRGFSIAVAVNMMDEVRANRKILDLAGMTELAGVPFFPLAAKSGEGVDLLRNFLGRETEAKEGKQPAQPVSGIPHAEISDLHRKARSEARELNRLNKGPRENLLMARDLKIDGLLLHPVLGPLIFLFTMFVLFQSIFTWAVPISDGIEAGIALLNDHLKATVTNELLASLLTDGVLAGMGSVLVFVPQIAILFLLIGLLEYSGYLPRVAYMVDRLMKPYGLDGKVFIPLLSSVACAVPGILSTRTIESERTRLITIMISPLMTCSARLPVYTLLIATFVPATTVGPFSLQGLVMFGMYSLAVLVALLVALVLHRLDFGKRKHLVSFLNLPHYRTPNWPELLRFVWTRVYSFLRKAGTIIFSMAVLLWALLSFPGSYPGKSELEAKIAASQDKKEELKLLEDQKSALRLEHSYGGRIGKALEPVFQPLGYDWKLTIGILASLAAREVFVATIGTVFSLGAVDDDTEGLTKALREEKKADGSPKYTIATCLSLLVFFAFSLQCISTIGVARRETNSWKIPALMFAYMFAIAYTGALVAYWAATAFLA